MAHGQNPGPPPGAAALRESERPVGIVVGDHDFLDFGNRLARKWIAEVPKIRLTIVKDAGHLLWVDQPETFAEALQAHVSGAGRR